MLINWFVSTFSEEHYMRHVVAPQDLKIMATQFCTHLLAAGVIRQIEDASAPIELLFRVSCGDLSSGFQRYSLGMWVYWNFGLAKGRGSDRSISTKAVE